MNDNISFLTDESEKEYIELIKENAEELVTMEEKIINVYPQLENLEVTPSVEGQVFNHENSYGYDEVKVKAIEDEDLIPENIKRGVNILGVEGTMVGGKFAPRYTYKPISFSRYTGTELDHETSMLDTTNFTDLSEMFYVCQNITSLDLSDWNTSNVTKMYQVFGNCNSLTSLNLKGWDTSNVTSMNSMFSWCLKLTHLDLSSFDTSKVTDMTTMFYVCQKLEYLDIRNFTFDNVTRSVTMFHNVPKNCLIIVKGQTEKDWVLAQRNDFTNVKTVEEYENGI